MLPNLLEKDRNVLPRVTPECPCLLERDRGKTADYSELLLCVLLALHYTHGYQCALQCTLATSEDNHHVTSNCGCAPVPALQYCARHGLTGV